MDNFKKAQADHDNSVPDWYWDEFEPEDVPFCCIDCKNRIDERCSIGVILPWNKQTCRRKSDTRK